jgi:hypothetical protein
MSGQAVSLGWAADVCYISLLNPAAHAVSARDPAMPTGAGFITVQLASFREGPDNHVAATRNQASFAHAGEACR